MLGKDAALARDIHMSFLWHMSKSSTLSFLIYQTILWLNWQYFIFKLGGDKWFFLCIFLDSSVVKQKNKGLH